MRKIILVLVIVAILVAIFLLERLRPEQLSSDELRGAEIELESIAEKDKKYQKAKEITKPSAFINTDGQDIKIADFIGDKVILLDIWTYSCINCQRTLPFITAWDEKYRDQGLLIVGIHTPEFEFEKDLENVKQAVKKWGIEYPVVLDNDRGTWQAYQNRYWPRKYLIDIDGYVVYDHIGEGAYDETEKKIQELLKERAQKLEQEQNISTDITDVQNQSADPNQSISPETYFGALRNDNFGNGQPGQTGLNSYTLPGEILVNRFYLEGDWEVAQESIINKSKNAKLLFLYRARDLYFVASALDELSNKRVRVSRDGQPLDSAAGQHLDEASTVSVKEADLYRLVEDQEYQQHLIELEFLDRDVEVFTFTFG